MEDSTVHQINEILKTVNRAITPPQIELFDRYRESLLQWNQRLNLTGVRTPVGIEQTHFVDSLSALLVTGPLTEQSLVDLGTGAGFPGLPLKIIYPSLKVTLVESVQKKVQFLEAVVDDLGLGEIEIRHDRAENVGQDARYRATFDWATARALAEMRIVLEYLAPLCRLNGRVLLLKGPDAENELRTAATAAAALGVILETIKRVPTAVIAEKERYLLVFEKVAATPDRYPRRVGVPAKRPL